MGGIGGTPTDLMLRCPRCGGIMHTTGSQYWCKDEKCNVEFIRIVTKTDWIERRQRHEATRQRELEKAVLKGENYPPTIQA